MNVLRVHFLLKYRSIKRINKTWPKLAQKCFTAFFETVCMYLLLYGFPCLLWSASNPYHSRCIIIYVAGRVRWALEFPPRLILNSGSDVSKLLIIPKAEHPYHEIPRVTHRYDGISVTEYRYDGIQRAIHPDYRFWDREVWLMSGIRHPGISRAGK